MWIYFCSPWTWGLILVMYLNRSCGSDVCDFGDQVLNGTAASFLHCLGSQVLGGESCYLVTTLTDSKWEVHLTTNWELMECHASKPRHRRESWLKSPHTHVYMCTCAYACTHTCTGVHACASMAYIHVKAQIYVNGRRAHTWVWMPKNGTRCLPWWHSLHLEAVFHQTYSFPKG